MIIGYVINGVLSVISAILVYLIKGLISENRKLREAKRSEDAERERALSAGVLSLLRIQLIEYHDKYMTREIIPVYIFENWDDMYQSYRALGGNGSIKKMNDEINRIRIGGGAGESH
jgi:hypothetical protein